ncbi:MAG: CPBP family intramembrane glutamic endopeptidase, partial [Planctomycetota bacterium]
AAVLLLAAPVLFPAWRFLAQPAQLPAFGGGLDELWRTLASFAVFGTLFLLLPALDQLVRRRGTLRGSGFGLGDWRAGLRWVAPGLPLALLIAWLGSTMADVRAEYPVCRLLLQRPDLLPWYAIGYALLYYVAWEGFFRGWLLFGLAEHFGRPTAVFVQTAASALAHLGKPAGELWGSIPFGLLLGALALRSNSIWYGWLLHVALGVATDALVVHG